MSYSTKENIALERTRDSWRYRRRAVRLALAGGMPQVTCCWCDKIIDHGRPRVTSVARESESTSIYDIQETLYVCIECVKSHRSDRFGRRVGMWVGVPSWVSYRFIECVKCRHSMNAMVSLWCDKFDRECYKLATTDWFLCPIMEWLSPALYNPVVVNAVGTHANRRVLGVSQGETEDLPACSKQVVYSGVTERRLIVRD